MGREFVSAVLSAIAAVSLDPLTPRLRHRFAGIRWVYPKRFPYRIVYRVESDRIVVFGIVHAARRDRG